MAQSGLRDVGDGLGLQPIEDASVAKRILDKVNRMNVDTGRDCLVLSALFAGIDQGLAVKLSTVALLTLMAVAWQKNKSSET